MVVIYRRLENCSPHESYWCFDSYFHVIHRYPYTISCSLPRSLPALLEEKIVYKYYPSASCAGPAQF